MLVFAISASCHIALQSQASQAKDLPQDAPLDPQRRAKEAQDGPKMGPRWAQDGPETGRGTTSKPRILIPGALPGLSWATSGLQKTLVFTMFSPFCWFPALLTSSCPQHASFLNQLRLNVCSTLHVWTNLEANMASKLLPSCLQDHKKTSKQSLCKFSESPSPSDIGTQNIGFPIGI